MKKFNETLKNLPRSDITRTDYETVCQQVVDAAKDNPEVASVYVMGGEWSVGISDLDIVIVYKSSNPQRLFPSPWSLSAAAKFCFTHRPLSFSQEAFKNFYYLYPETTTNLRLLWGQEHVLADPQKELIAEDFKDLLAFILFDTLVNKLLLFPRFKKQSVKDVRQIIGELYSLHYTQKIVAEITGQSIGQDFLSQITLLRQNWFIDGQASLAKLFKLVDPAWSMVLEALSSLQQFASTRGWPKQELSFISKKFSVLFSDSWSPDNLEAELMRRSLIFTLPGTDRKIENFCLTLPSSLGSFILCYFSGSGLFSSAVREATRTKFAFEARGAGLVNHVKSVNEVFAAMIESRGLFKVPFSYGLPIRSIGNWKYVLLRNAIKFVRIFQR